jgi:energy-coupling factor transporter ATP-binding protein EcfA2
VPAAIEVPQDPDLTLFCATVDAELRYGPTERGWTGDDVPRIAADLGLGDLLDRPPHGLSRGQRLRTAVGAVLTCRPRILLLDEPTAGQDPDAVERVMAVVDRELGDGALLFATHDEDLAGRWANRVVRLRDGRLSEER